MRWWRFRCPVADSTAARRFICRLMVVGASGSSKSPQSEAGVEELLATGKRVVGVLDPAGAEFLVTEVVGILEL